jgi:regulator of replication initiation timing
MKFTDTLNTSKDVAKEAIFGELDKRAIDALSKLSEGVMNSLKAAHALGYKYHYDIPEESDDRMEHQKLVAKMDAADAEAGKKKKETEANK